MGWEKPNSLIMKWRKWALQISLLIDEVWNSSQAHSRSVDYKALTTALLENLSRLLPWYAPCMFHCSVHSQLCGGGGGQTARIFFYHTANHVNFFLSPAQRATATCTPAAADSTWSCISCQGGRAEGSAWTAATTPPAATATTARRAFTGTWPGRSLTGEPAKVRMWRAQIKATICSFFLHSK